MLAECTTGADRALDVEGWKKEVDTKSSMRLDEVVQALRSIWGVVQDNTTDNPNETSVDELRWMLWALKHLDPSPERDNSPSRKKEPETEKKKRLLVLHDTHGQFPPHLSRVLTH